MTIRGAPWVIERTTQELCKSAHIRSSKCTFATEGIVTRAAGHCQLRKTWPLLSRNHAWPSKNYTNRTTDGLANAVLQTAKPLVVAPRRRSCRAEKAVAPAVAPKKLLRERKKNANGLCRGDTAPRQSLLHLDLYSTSNDPICNALL